MGRGAAPTRAFASVNDDVVPKKVTQHPYITGNARYMPGFSFPAPRRLEQIVKYALLERESPARITEVWRDFHAPRLDCVAAVWSPAELAAITERRRRRVCPRLASRLVKIHVSLPTFLWELLPPPTALTGSRGTQG
jgi:hypothetical protein